MHSGEIAWLICASTISASKSSQRFRHCRITLLVDVVTTLLCAPTSMDNSLPYIFQPWLHEVSTLCSSNIRSVAQLSSPQRPKSPRNLEAGWLKQNEVVQRQQPSGVGKHYTRIQDMGAVCETPNQCLRLITTANKSNSAMLAKTWARYVSSKHSIKCRIDHR
jgi:hypothetical protein